MKLIKQFKDDDYEATNYIYEFDSGLKLVVTQKENIKDFYAGIVFKAGSILCKQLNVPQGSTHFLEHLMITSPNKYFENEDAMKEFSFGTYDYPKITVNGTTSKYAMWLYTTGHFYGKDRALKILKSFLTSYGEDFRESIEKQRKIILSERNKDKKEEKDSGHMYAKFLFEDDYPEYVKKIDGNLDDIESISVKDLIEVRQEILKGENACIVIQTNEWEDKDILEDIQEIADQFSKEQSSLQFREVDFKNRFKYKYFVEDSAQDIFFSYNIILPTRSSYIDYKQDAIEFFSRSLISKISNEYLRENKHLVYSANAFSSYCMFRYTVSGFKSSVPKEKLAEFLESVETMISNFWKEYLFSDVGKRWFESIVSTQIFTKTNEFSLDYAKRLGVNIMCGDEIVKDFNKYVDAVKEVSLEEVSEYIEKYFKLEPHLWIIGSEPEEEVLETLRSSKLYKRLSEQK